jgi:hypothetical protein
MLKHAALLLGTAAGTCHCPTGAACDGNGTVVNRDGYCDSSPDPPREIVDRAAYTADLAAQRVDVDRGRDDPVRRRPSAGMPLRGRRASGSHRSADSTPSLLRAVAAHRSAGLLR